MFTVVAIQSLLADNSADAGAVSAVVIFFWLVLVIISLIIQWRIAQKAGFPGWYSLGLIVPLLNLILIVLFAFTEWPIERELRLLRGIAIRPTASIR